VSFVLVSKALARGEIGGRQINEDRRHDELRSRGPFPKDERGGGNPTGSVFFVGRYRHGPIQPPDLAPGLDANAVAPSETSGKPETVDPGPQLENGSPADLTCVPVGNQIDSAPHPQKRTALSLPAQPAPADASMSSYGMKQNCCSFRSLQCGVDVILMPVSVANSPERTRDTRRDTIRQGELATLTGIKMTSTPH